MYATIRQEKIKGSKSFNGRTEHNDRTFFTPNINQKLTPENITLFKNQYKNYENFVETKKEELKFGNQKNGTKNRFPRQIKNEDSALNQEFVISSSNSALTKEENIEYLKDAHDFLKEWFEDCEVIQSEIHLDEKTPHLHFVTSYFSTVQKKFIQKELSQKGKTDINKIRDAFQKKVADKYGLKKQDGKVVAAAEHQSKANVQIGKLKKELKAKNEMIEKMLEMNKKAKTDNQKLHTELETRLRNSNERGQDVEYELRTEMLETQKELNKALEAQKELQTTNDTQKERLEVLEANTGVISPNHKEWIEYGTKAKERIKELKSENSTLKQQGEAALERAEKAESKVVELEAEVSRWTSMFAKKEEELEERNETDFNLDEEIQNLEARVSENKSGLYKIK